MRRERGRQPGDLLGVLLARILSHWIVDGVVVPALADLQHESALARGETLWRRAWVLVRGYLALWRAVGLCLATWLARSLQRDWMDADAVGPTLLRTLTPRAGIVGLGFALLMVTREPYRLALVTHDPWLALHSLLSVLTVAVPLSFFFGNRAIVKCCGSARMIRRPFPSAR